MIIACCLLQISLINIIPVISVRANILLILTVSMGLMRGKHTGLWVGFISGLLVDLFSGSVFGLNALTYMYIGYINGKFYKVFYDDDIRVPLVLTGISCFAYNIVSYIILFLLGQRFNFLTFLRYSILPEIIYTLIFTLVLYKLIFIINQKLIANELEDSDSPWLIK